MRKTILTAFLLLTVSFPCRAGDMDVKLTTTNGTTKFTIKDSGGNEVTTVTSAGTLTVSSNTILTGTTFYQNGSAILGVAGQSVTVSSNFVVSGAMVANASPGTSGQFLQSQGPGTTPTWAAAGGVQYMGLTGTTYDGNQGGFVGMNSNCNSAFAGSHICTQGEILRSGATSLAATGWVSCDSVGYYYDGATLNFFCNGVIGQITSLTNYMTCDQWRNNTNAGGASWSGPTVGTTVNFGSNVCYTALKIHCCK